MGSDCLFDLCIVGAGMFGSAAARHASAVSELKTCLIGPPEIPYEDWTLSGRDIFASHYDEGRITRTFDESEDMQIFGVKSIGRYRELEKLSGISFYHDVGCLYMGTENNSFIKSVRESVAKGLQLVDLSNSETFTSEFPFLRKKDDELAFLDNKGAGHISPRRMVQAQQIVSAKQGCQLIPEIVDAVGQFKKDDETLLKVKTESGREVFAKKVLVCTNAFTNFRNLLPKQADISILPETVAMLRIADEEAQRLSKMPSMIYHRETNDETKMNYILPPIKYPDGNWYAKIGYSGLVPALSSSAQVKEWYLSKGSVDAMNDHAKTLQELLPGVKVESVIRNSCVTCHSPTGLPYIDKATSNISVAIAGNGIGAKLSDEVGRIAAHLAITGEWNSEVVQTVFRIQWQK